MGDDTFIKRPGTTDKGKDYEDLMVAFYILQMIKNPDIKNFKISSNDKNFGSFDDIILEIETLQGLENFALQLKHSNREKVLHTKSLEGKEGNFAIQKYMKSFRKDYKLIIFTNFKFTLTEKDKKQIKLSDGNLNLTIKECLAEPLINTNSEQNCYKFQVDETSSSSVENNIFFDNFFLYPNQNNVEIMKEIISKKFKDMFKSDAFQEFLKFVADWSLREGKKEKLDKDLMERVIAIFLFSPCIIPISPSGNGNNRNNKENLKLLKEAISNFSVTIFDSDLKENVQKIWADDFQENKSRKKDERNIIKNKYQIANDDSNGKVKLLWLMGKCPLIVEESATTTVGLELCKNNKVIVLSKNPESIKPEKVPIFRKLSDLSKMKIYSRITESFKCLFQGKEVTLQFLINQNQQVNEIVTPNELIKMVSSFCIVGGEGETLPIPYIPRFLSSNIIDFKYFDVIDKDTLVLISGVKDFDQIKKQLRNCNVIRIKEKQKMNKIVKVFDGANVFISEELCSHREFDNICNGNEAKKYHHLRSTEDGRLEWIQSRNYIGDLEDYRSEDCFVEESNFYNLENDLKIICADPGMGKTVLMKNLKNNISSEMWVITVSSKDISSLSSSRTKDFINNILGVKYKNYSSFDLKFLEILMKQGQVVLIWDGLDQSSDEDLKMIMNIIDEFSKNGFSQWITSRKYLKKVLERRFCVFARTLRQFEDKAQRDYIQTRLNSQEDLEDIIIKITNNLKFVENNDVLGIPLQIFMFTELLRQNPKKYINLLKDDIFSITDLYHYFVDEKFNLCYKEKMNFGNLMAVEERFLKEHKIGVIKEYEKAALKMLFNEELQELQFDCEDFLERIREEGDSYGLIIDIAPNNAPIFFHNSYGEYFAALYFSRNYKNIPNFKKIIFGEKYTNIRFLFDLLLATNCPAHIAVLYRKLEALKKCEIKIKPKDLGGRNPLHLASSWGERYPLLNTHQNGGIFMIDEDLVDSVKEENPEYCKILEYLLEKCDPYEVDEIFNMDAIMYADTSLCLLPFTLLATPQQVKSANFENFGDTPSILFYFVKFGYESLMDCVQELHLIKTKSHGSLLHIAVENHQINWLQKILSTNKYKEAIDDVNGDNNTPLFIACTKEYIKIAEILINSGADIEKQCSSGITPLSVACFRGYEGIVQLLIESGADVNKTITSGHTPLHAACIAGYDEIAKLLINSNADMSITNSYGHTPFFMACYKGDVKMVRLLLDSGVSVDLENTPVHIASYNGDDQMIQLLIDYGIDINKGDKFGVTPIHKVCQNGHESTLELLFAYGANINCRDDEGFTPLYMACSNGHDKIVQMLIKQGADVNISSNRGNSPIAVACKNGHDKIVQLLISSKADINHGNCDHLTPMHIATRMGHFEIIQLLIIAGADGNCVDVIDGNTPLFLACQYGHFEICQVLIDSGADLNKTNGNNLSPLHIACQEGFTEIVNLLINNGANVNCVDIGGRTPLFAACANRQLDIVRFLINHGASVNQTNCSGDTCVDIAFRNEAFDIVKLLIASGATQ